MSSRKLPESLPPEAVAPTLFGYTLYRVCLLSMYVMFIALGVWALLNYPQKGGPVGGVMIAIGAVFGLGVLASFKAPVTPWAWSYHATVIALGVPLIVTTPFAVLIGLAWLKPEVKTFYGIELVSEEADEEAEGAPPPAASA